MLKKILDAAVGEEWDIPENHLFPPVEFISDLPKSMAIDPMDYTILHDPDFIESIEQERVAELIMTGVTRELGLDALGRFQLEVKTNVSEWITDNYESLRNKTPWQQIKLTLEYISRVGGLTL